MFKKTLPLILLFNFLISGGNYDYSDLNITFVFPFFGILLSIAIIPLINHHFWEENFGKVSLFWSLLFFVPFWYFYKDAALYELLHVVLLEYIPFIMLIGALFVISGGIKINGSLVGTPKMNSLFLLIGFLLASWMGTTGAAMLLIRPLINANRFRKHKVHIIIFFIFLVANIGGALTPLGDPPLFLGFLNGVDFFWTTVHLLAPMLILGVLLLFIFFILDTYYYRCEHVKDPNKPYEPITIDGKFNFILLFGVILVVLISGTWNPHIHFTLYGVHLNIQNLLRDILLLIFGLLSWKLTLQEIRRSNAFTWFPIIEVSKLFIGIFITIIPVIALLKLGSDGPLGFIINLTRNPDMSANNTSYFWVTGILSGFLDNAPTYLVFFNSAGGDAYSLMKEIPITLKAISCGAVFMGAMTYIGNAPNFMIRSIAEENDIKMPSFFGYMVWSISILFPLFLIISYIYF